jgi:hypothetical protein
MTKQHLAKNEFMCVTAFTRKSRIASPEERFSEVAEWSKAAVSKTVDPERGPGVRIPPLPAILRRGPTRRRHAQRGRKEESLVMADRIGVGAPFEFLWKERGVTMSCPALHTILKKEKEPNNTLQATPDDAGLVAWSSGSCVPPLRGR